MLAWPVDGLTCLPGLFYVSFDLTKEMCERTEWTLAVVQDRQTTLVARAKALWSIEMSPSQASKA